jgi:hypothetical protein
MSATVVVKEDHGVVGMLTGEVGVEGTIYRMTTTGSRERDGQDSK